MSRSAGEGGRAGGRAEDADGSSLAVVVGGSGGVGAALVAALRDCPAYDEVLALGRRGSPALDLLDEASIAAAAAAVRARGVPTLVFDATGFLHGGGMEPEKSWRELDPAHLAHAFAINAIGPALLMKHFLPLLPRERRAGLAEAVKVALIRDAAFFATICARAEALAASDHTAFEETIATSARLHFEHIAGGGDPFERGRARPLDFGHWAAHKLELLSQHRISHGHAVAVGIALDALYAACIGLLPEAQALRILRTLRTCGLPVTAPECLQKNRRDHLVLLDGLEEFRAHLGGELTLTLPAPLGSRIEIHTVDETVMAACIRELARWK